MLGKFRISIDSFNHINNDGCSGDGTIITSSFDLLSVPTAENGHYFPHERCKWVLLGKQNTIARFTILKFDTEKDFDPLFIYAGMFAAKRHSIGPVFLHLSKLAAHLSLPLVLRKKGLV